MKRRLTDRAFTLIEMITAMGIIAILTVMLLGVVKTTKERAGGAVCAGNLRQIYSASQAWSQDNSGLIVPVFAIMDPNNAGSLRNWTGLLAPYLGRDSTNNFASASELKIAVCPSQPRKFGYGYNYNYLTWPRPGNVQLAYAVSISRPSETVFLVDSHNAASVSEEFTSWRPYVRPPSYKWLNDQVPNFIHAGKTANVLWLDGHISAETENSEFWKNDKQWDRE